MPTALPAFSTVAWRKVTTRSLLTTVGACIDIGTLSNFPLPAGVIQLGIAVKESGYVQSKWCVFTPKSNETGGAWQNVIADKTSGPGAGGDDLQLEIKVTANDVSFRIRRVAGSILANPRITIEYMGVETPTWVESNVMGSSSTTTTYPGSAGGGGAAPGADTQFIYNDAGVLTGAPGLAYEAVSDQVLLSKARIPSTGWIEASEQPFSSGTVFFGVSSGTACLLFRESGVGRGRVYYDRDTDHVGLQNLTNANGVRIFDTGGIGIGNNALLAAHDLVVDVAAKLVYTNTRLHVDLPDQMQGPVSSGATPMLRVQGTIKQTGTAGYTAILVNMTEVTVGTGFKNLLDLQMAGTSRMSVTNEGTMVLTRKETTDPVAEPILRLTTETINDNPDLMIYQGRVNTNNEVPTTLWSYLPGSGHTYLIEARVVARRISGAGAGAPGDSAAYIRRICVRSITSSVSVVGSGVQDGFTSETQAGWDCTIDVDLSTTVRVRVTGSIDAIIAWHVTVFLQAISV